MITATNIDRKRVRELLTAGEGPGSDDLEIIGEGFWSIAVEVGNGMVFRIPRLAEGREKLEREMVLLREIAPDFPVRVPKVERIVEPSAVLPYGAFGHRKLFGRHLMPGAIRHQSPIAEDLALFLIGLHGVNLERARRLGAFEPDLREEWRTLRAEVMPVLEGILTSVELAAMERLFRALLEDATMLEFERTLIHGDLWYEHVLLDRSESHVTGILDFGDASIGDPAEDLAVQRYPGDSFFEEVFQIYTDRKGNVDPNLHHRTARYWELRELTGIQWAIRFQDEGELLEGVEKLRHCISTTLNGYRQL